MIAYAAQEGWLLARPEGSEQTRQQMFGRSMPDIPDSETLVETWSSLGCATVLPLGGFTQFSWLELDAFTRLTDADMGPLEMQTLMDMSRAFARASADENPLSKPPMERLDD